MARRVWHRKKENDGGERRTVVSLENSAQIRWSALAQQAREAYPR